MLADFALQTKVDEIVLAKTKNCAFCETKRFNA